MLRAVTGQPDDVETRLLQEAGYAFAEQDVILGDDDPHGTSPGPPCSAVSVPFVLTPM